MKSAYTYFSFAIALLTLTFTSCENEEAILMKKTVEVTIKPSSVVSSFTPRHRSDFDIDPDIKIRLTVLIYDSYSEKLIEKTEYLLDNYDQQQKVQIPVEYPTNGHEKTKMLVFASNIVLDGNETIYEAYTIAGTDKMSSLKIEQGVVKSLGVLNLLGYGSLDINFVSGTSEYELNLKPLSALVYVVYDDIHAHDYDSNAIDQYGFIYHGNDIVQYNVRGGNVEYATSLAASSNFADFMTPTNYPEYDIVYSQVFMLPGSFNTFGRVFIGNNRYDYSENKITITAGSQHTFTFDCDRLSVSYN